MFNHELHSYSQNKRFHRLQPSHSSPSHALEVQFEVCQLFLKKTGQQMTRRESQLMISSHQLLSRVSPKEGERTTDFDSETSISQRMQQLQQGGSTLRGQARKVQSKFGIWLRQVQDNCSQLCLANLKALVTDYQKLLEKRWEVQIQENIANRKYNHLERLEQQILILKNKITSQNEDIQALEQETQTLRQKQKSVVEYTNQRLQEVIGQQKNISLNAKVYREIKNYLEDREKLANSKISRAQTLQRDLVEKLTASMPGDSCGTCCTLLRKLKDSLMNFRANLVSESGQMQEMYNRYKKTLFSLRGKQV